MTPATAAGARRGLALGQVVLRWGLVAILLYFGAFKFTDAEARAIEPLVRNSPLMSWLYAITDVAGASRLIGAGEIVIAGLIATWPWLPRAAAAGSLLAALTFATTLSFLVTTPGVWEWVEGFPAPGGAAAFILKDVFLLGAALVTGATALERA